MWNKFVIDLGILVMIARLFVILHNRLYYLFFLQLQDVFHFAETSQFCGRANGR